MNLIATTQQVRERREAASSSEHMNRFQHGGLADAVLSRKQGYATETGHPQVVDPAKSLDGEAWKVERLAHGVLHRQAKLYHFAPRVSEASVIVSG